MINIDMYLAAALTQIGRAKVYSGPFPEEDDVWTRVQQSLNKGIDFLTAKGMKIPLFFRYADVQALYSPYFDSFERSKQVRSRKGGAVAAGAVQKVVDLEFIEQLLETFRERSLDFVRRISELCLVFGITLDCFEENLEYNKYLLLEFFFETVPQLKYSTNLAYTRFWKVEDPEYIGLKYFGFDLFPKRLAVELKRLCSKDNERRFSAQVKINTLFMGFKKGLLPSGPEVVQKSLNTNAKKLAKETSVDEDLLDDVQDKVRQLVRYQTGKDTLNYSMLETDNQSSKSTLQSPYADGGNIGYAREELYGTNGFYNAKYGCKDPPESSFLRIPDVYQEFIGFVRDKNGPVDSEVIPVYAVCPIFTKDMLEVFPDTVIQYSNTPRVLSNDVSPSFILEPMKVRTITRPSTGVHVRMHKIQKTLWRFLYKHDSGFFDLIGEPLNTSHLIPLVRDLRPGDKFVSGDYSAATDNLKADISKTIIEELLRGLNDPILAYNIYKTLTEAKISQTLSHFPTYGNAFDKFKYQVHEPFMQKNGQLMGHVISFIVLCLANIVCYWQSVELYLKRTVKLAELKRDYPVRVNGDDILFKTRGTLYECWDKMLAHYGFEPSVGKNFVTDKFMQVNSKLYRVDTFLDEECAQVRLRDLVEIPYVNFGLLTNRNKQDCSKDTSVSRISTVDLGRGSDIEEESLLGRLKTYPKIFESILCYEENFENQKVSRLPLSLQGVAGVLMERHIRPVMGHFGMSSLYKELPNPAFREVYGQYIVRNNKVIEPSEVDKLSVFGELSPKLDRGTLSFEYQMPRQLLKLRSSNPFYIYPTIKEPKVEYIRA